MKNKLLKQSLMALPIVLIFAAMFIGSLHGLTSLKNTKTEIISFDSIRQIDNDSRSYIIKDTLGRTFNIENPNQSSFFYDKFKTNVTQNEEITITYASENTVLEIKDAKHTYLGHKDSYMKLSQNYKIFMGISLFFLLLSTLFWIACLKDVDKENPSNQV